MDNETIRFSIVLLITLIMLGIGFYVIYTEMRRPIEKTKVIIDVG